MLGAGRILRRPLHVVGPVPGARNRGPDRVEHGIRLHLKLVLHMHWARGDEGVDAWPLGVLQRLACPINILKASAGKPTDGRILDELGNSRNRLEIAVRRDGKAGLNDVDTHLIEKGGHFQLFFVGHRGAWGLLPVPQRRVENPYTVHFARPGLFVYAFRTRSHAPNPSVRREWRASFHWLMLSPKRPSRSAGTESA